jgi:putative SOS response-associated peptidase YedK
MCGRYVQTMPAEVLRQLFRTNGALPNLAPSWNVAPTQSAPVVRRHPETGERHLDLLRWGLLPRWAKDPRGARQPINARAETVASSPMFREAYAKRRCLVPADAFYEWQALPGGGKQPIAIAPRSGEGMAFAGIWEGWRGEEGGEVVRTFAIVTTDANATMRTIHERMPVILAPDDWAEWLEGDDPAALLRPAPDGLLRFWPVSKAVNSPRNNGPELLAEQATTPGESGGPNPA